ncbi:MAG TPA: hypothetical protein VKT25_12015 [Ktedonobacteraceae bacterium]|nr:hypothetical protein [Ktedonobacteraceae bacterium]
MATSLGEVKTALYVLPASALTAAHLAPGGVFDELFHKCSLFLSD